MNLIVKKEIPYGIIIVQKRQISKIETPVNRYPKQPNLSFSPQSQFPRSKMPDVLQVYKKNVLGMSRHVIKLPEDQQQQKLSYQTNKLAQYIELQLSDLQNTLHYIQKKHSINQIKESISHSYNIFSETQPIFRELRINFIYDKIKKLVNCFSIIYLILMEHVEKPSRLSVDTSDASKNNDPQVDGTVSQHEGSTNASRKNTILGEKKKTLTHYSQLTNEFGQSLTNGGIKRPKPLGGVHLYNQQYNRHIESDLDRLKRKLKEEAKQSQQSNTTKISQKQRLKEEIFKQINTDIYGSPSPDELTLFFNLNSNRYGSELQYITFQDQLQEIAAFFKESQDEALEFLNKSRDDFIFLNFNQGFKEMISQYKVEKEDQVNGFIGKVKNLFQAIKIKTLQKQHNINIQINELKKLQERIIKPVSFEIQTQTSFNLEEQLSRLRKRIQQLQSNYNSLQDYHKKENQNQEKNITLLEHKIALKDHQISLLKKQLDEKNHFIDFLNDKINNGTDPKVLRKISNLYRNHSKKNSSKLKVELEELERNGAAEIKNLKNRKLNNDDLTNGQNEKVQALNSQGEAIDPKVQANIQEGPMSHLPQYERPNKRKRKQGISFFASPQKRFTSYIQRNASFNIQNTKIQQANSQMQKATSGDIPLYEQQFENNKQTQNQEGPQSNLKKDKTKKNLVKHDKRQTQQRNSLQVVQKSKTKMYEPKRSAFASGLTGIGTNNQLVPGVINENKTDSKPRSRGDSIRGDNSQKSFGGNSNFDQEEDQLMKQINIMAANHNSEEEKDSYFDENDEERCLDDSNVEEFDSEINQEDFNDGKGNVNGLESFGKFNKQGVNNNRRLTSQNRKTNKQQRLQGDQQNNNAQKGNDKNIKPTNKSKTLEPNHSPKTNSNNSTMIQKSPNIKSPTPKTPKKSTTFSVKKSFSNQVETDQEAKASGQRFRSFQQNQKGTLLNKDMTNNQDSNENENDMNAQRRANKQSSRNYQGQGQQEIDDLENENNPDEQFLQQNQTNDKTETFLKAVSSFSNLGNLNNQQKEKITTLFTTLYKEQKVKLSALQSRLIEISIPLSNDATNHSSQKASNNQVLISVPNKDLEMHKLNTINNYKFGSNMKSQDITSIRDKSINTSSRNLSDLKKSKSKLSQLSATDSLMKFRQTKVTSQNLIENLSTFQEITITQELKQEEDNTQRSGDELNEQSQINRKRPTIERKPFSPSSTDYERIYGIATTSCNRNQRQTSQISLLNPQDRAKMQEYLEKAAIKAAIKSKNVEEFKAKIKKLHMSKCGQNCRHLERYLENFNKYKNSNRETLKIHIENVNHSIVSHQQQSQNGNRVSKQNSVNFPSINTLNTTGFSSKGFNSVQRNITNGTKK